uniref:Secreted protein n=1 Tax=Steinernema glaseri TaxID=37863 RepID=A0A1I8A811_9BILA
MKGAFHVCTDSDPHILWMLSTMLVILIACISIVCCAGCIYGSIVGLARYVRTRDLDVYSTSDPKVSVATSYTLNPNPSVKHFDSTYHCRKTTV